MDVVAGIVVPVGGVALGPGAVVVEVPGGIVDVCVTEGGVEGFVNVAVDGVTGTVDVLVAVDGGNVGVRVGVLDGVTDGTRVDTLGTQSCCPVLILVEEPRQLAFWSWGTVTPNARPRRKRLSPRWTV